MNNMLATSIVIYHNNTQQVYKVIKSFLSTKLKVKLYFIDNSSDNNLKKLSNFDNKEMEYIFNNKNLRYGTAHNIGIYIFLITLKIFKVSILILEPFIHKLTLKEYNSIGGKKNG